MAAGYSKKSLVEKLGIKDGFTISIVAAPKNYATTLGKLPSGVKQSKKREGPIDFLQFFCSKRSRLEDNFPTLKEALSPSGMLWISWPKASSGVSTDLSESVVREIGLRNGLVDVKVCAVDETWSGLKFVFRVKDRFQSR
jgi:hypothetical protein